LNCASSDYETNCIISCEIVKKSSSIVELDGRVSDLAVATRKPFDLLAKGLLQKDSRGGRTPVELFYCAICDLAMTVSVLLRQLATSKSGRESV